VKLATAAARAGWHIHEHTMSNWSVSDLLDAFEALDATVPIEHLRWTLAHVYDISPENIARAKSLGMTLAVHGVAMHGRVRMPLRAIQDSGIVWGLGTDATIVSHYQPFVTLGWIVSGLDLAGNRVLDETVTREEALIAHALERVSVLPGARARLARGRQARRPRSARIATTSPCRRPRSRPFSRR
jgi:predicted amidohydrolase YtcJ